ncbi:MAG: hypothetical protein KJ821_05330 [Actinobacteria bacterium]|nr:hypothetical protein [Actinomycetota bacterium]MBU4483466.1 hypothetical protein [Actinomycetota bacterium]MCG2790985.1 hypothetical protein [Actinomycetes bacterium]
MEIIKILENAFIKARKYLLTEGYEEAQVVRKNPSGDISRAFDIKAEEILINDLVREFPGFGIIPSNCRSISSLQISWDSPVYIAPNFSFICHLPLELRLLIMLRGLFPFRNPRQHSIANEIGEIFFSLSLKSTSLDAIGSL